MGIAAKNGKKKAQKMSKLPYDAKSYTKIVKNCQKQKANCKKAKAIAKSQNLKKKIANK